MSHSERSKGKGRSRDSTAQSISLSDCHDYQTASAPRSLFAEPLGSFYQDGNDQGNQTSASGDQYYRYDAGGQYATGADQPWLGTGGLSSSPPRLPGSGLKNDTPQFGTSISSNNTWDMPSSQNSISSYGTTPSQGYPTSVASTPPPRYTRDPVLNHIQTQPQATQSYQLPCEVQGCTEVFLGDESAEWANHTESHFGGSIPSKLRCWFDCDFYLFDSRRAGMGGDTYGNFQNRMQHIREHILDGYQPRNRVPDGYMIEHLFKQGLIDEPTRREWLKPSRVPDFVREGRSEGSASGSGSYGNDSYHPHRSQHVYLPVVVEEARSSGYRERRSEKKSERKEHRHDSHSSTHKRKPAK